MHNTDFELIRGMIIEEEIRRRWHFRRQRAKIHQAHFDSENLVSNSLHDPLEFSSRRSWISPLGKRISDALLPDVLVEVFGP